MWLKLDVCGMEISFRIRDYKPSHQDDWDSQWCHCDFAFISGDWLNYHKESDEILLSCEIEDLESALTKLLNDETPKTHKISFIEPDFVFSLHPKQNLRNDPQYLYIQPGFEIADIYVEWRVFFWNCGLTDNFLTVTLGRKDIISLRDYLSSIIKCK